MDRIKNEKAHGAKIRQNAEAVWNWDSPSGRKRANRRAELLHKVANIKSTDFILEIGCGTGLFTEKILKLSGCKIIAVDISNDLLEEAKKKNLAGDVTFQIADAMNLSFQDNTFDVVFGSSVLHHLDMKKSFQEISRVLKPGGRMVFAEPNMVNPQIFIQKNIPFIKKLLGDSPDETAIFRWNTKKELEKIGFNKVKIFPYDFLHPIVPSFLTRFVELLGKFLEKIPIIKEIAGSVIIYAEKPKH